MSEATDFLRATVPFLDRLPETNTGARMIALAEESKKRKEKDRRRQLKEERSRKREERWIRSLSRFGEDGKRQILAAAPEDRKIYEQAWEEVNEIAPGLRSENG